MPSHDISLPATDTGRGPFYSAVLHTVLALSLAYFWFFVLLVGRQVPTGAFLAMLGGTLAMLGLSLVNVQAAALLLAAATPLVSGLCVATDHVTYIALAFLFTGLYSGWYPRFALRALRDSACAPHGPVAFLVTLMLALLILSAAGNTLSLEPDYMALNLFSPRSFHINSGLYFIHALNITAQGLLFLFILHNECDGPAPFRLHMVSVAHVTTIVVFALVQLFDSGFFLKRGLSWPFDDIHSYGSALVLFTVLFLSMGVWQRRARFTVLGLLAFVLCLMSWSRTALLAVTAFVLMLCLGLGTPARRMVAMLGVALAIALVLTLSSRINQMDIGLTQHRGLVGRAYTSLNARLERWGETLRICATFPVAGTGIGTQYRVFGDFKGDDREIDGPDRARRKENTHNYLLQMQAEVGLFYTLALATLLWLLMSRALAPADDDRGTGRSVALALAAYAITMLTGHALLLLSHQFLFFYYLAYVLTVNPPRELLSPRRLDAALAVVLAVFVLATALKVPRFHSTLLDGYGYVELEGKKDRPLEELTLAPGPVAVQWLRPRGPHMGILFQRTGHAKGPVMVGVSLDGALRDEVVLLDEGPVARYYAVDSRARAVECTVRTRCGKPDGADAPCDAALYMAPPRSYAMPLPEGYTIN